MQTHSRTYVCETHKRRSRDDIGIHIHLCPCALQLNCVGVALSLQPTESDTGHVIDVAGHLSNAG